MKNIIEKIFWGRDTMLSGLIALAVVGAIALGCNCNKSFDFDSNSSSNTTSDNPFGTSSDESGEMPPKDLQTALVNETTADFAVAIGIGDFTKMHEKASPEFQKSYTAEQMADTFKEFTNKRKQVMPIISRAVGAEPEYATPPYVRKENGLDIFVAKGKYDTKPIPMNFEYEYVKRGGQWKMIKLIVKLTK